MRRGSIAGLAVGLALLAAPAGALAEQVLYVGDSLGVGTTPGFARELGSSAQVRGNSRIGRPSSEGLRVLGQMLQPSDDIVVFDLGTNDAPANPAALASDLAAARRLTGNRCLIVATLNRPRYQGVTVDGLNQALIAFASSARNVQLVDWNAIVASQPSLLGRDRIHATPQGYALRAQLFAQAAASCGSSASSNPDLLATPAPAPKRRHHAPRPKPRPPIKVPGIESSGISFTVPLRVNGLPAQLFLPNAKPPYPAVVMLGATQTAAEYAAARGIAALTYRDRGSAADARAAVALLRHRKGVRPDGVALWAFGAADDEAARVAAGNRAVAAVVVMSPALVAGADERDWRARRAGDDPAVAKWIRLQASADSTLAAQPADVWRRVGQPVFAVWGTRDRGVPIHASAAELRSALEAGPNHDRTFRWFDAGHDGTVSNKDGEPVYAPGLLAETSRWLGLRLGEHRARPVVGTQLPPVNGPPVRDASHPSALYSPPLQLLWLIVPALMLGVAAIRSEGLIRLAAAATLAAIACFGAIALGAATLAGAPGRHLAQVAGTAWPFALAVALAVVLAVCGIALARRRAWLAAAAAGLWLALALFWLV